MNWIEKNGSLILGGALTLGGGLTIPSGSNLVIGSTTLTEAELGVVDGIATPGTVVASKAIVVDANKDITSMGNITATGKTFTCQTVNASDNFIVTREVLNTAGTTSGSVTARQSIINVTTSIVNNTATPIATFTVPNAAHAAMARITILGTLGTGGAIGTNEASGGVSYNLGITRTAGVATVATMSSAYGSAMANVSGGATITVTSDLSSISGLSSATQTFDLRVTIARGSGSASNHLCAVVIELLNYNASGVTVT